MLSCWRTWFQNHKKLQFQLGRWKMLCININYVAFKICCAVLVVATVSVFCHVDGIPPSEQKARSRRKSSKKHCFPFLFPLSIDSPQITSHISILLHHCINSAVQEGREIPFFRCQDRGMEGTCPSTNDTTSPHCFLFFVTDAKVGWKSLISKLVCLCIPTRWGKGVSDFCLHNDLES